MLASVAIDPIQFAFAAAEPTAPAPVKAPRSVSPEQMALIEEIKSIEGVVLTQSPMLFRFVVLCGSIICVGASGGLILGVADLVARMI